MATNDPTPKSGTESRAEPPPDRSGLPRRPLLKALGAGAALSLGAGAASADDDAGIDPVYGYSTQSASEVPSDLAPDREVELTVTPPEDHENPARPELFHFAPTGLRVEAGDVVQFTFATPDHTVTAYHPAHGFQRRVPQDVPPFSSPIVTAAGAWLYRFEEPGVYDLYCGPHHILGMAMRLVVGDAPAGEHPEYVGNFEPPADSQLLGPFGRAFLEAQLNRFDNEDAEWAWLTPREVLGADALAPENVRSTGAVSIQTVFEEIDRFDG